MNLATVDIGTNTTLLLVARTATVVAGTLEGSQTPRDGIRRAEPVGSHTIVAIEERAEITRLGRGIGGDGRLGAEGITRTLAALKAFADVARRHGAPIAAVGTEALRRAPNADDFLRPAAEALGTEIEVIDGAREAALTFRAVTASFPETRDGALSVVDIGGGSTEIVLATDGQPTYRVSLPLGSVRLTESLIRHDPPEPGEIEAVAQAVDRAIAPVPFPPVAATLVGVAGTVTSLAAMALALASYDPARVHGYRLARAELGRQIQRLAEAGQAERERMIGLDPRRADVILAGALILDRIARAAGASDIQVSDRGIRWGLLHEILESGRAA